MIAFIGAGLCGVVIILSILLILGLPLGEFTMGGQFDKIPKKLRIIVLLFQLLMQIFFCVIILQTGGHMPLWFSEKITRVICIVLAVYLSVNTVANFCSRSKKEKYIITPLSLLTAICFWITAL